MRNRNIILKVASILAAVVPAVASAQSSSINTFSPYTFYGLGDFSTQGPAFLRAMGGSGVAYHNPFQSTFMNTLNPASYGSVNRNSFILNVEMEGQNFYSETADASTSYNTFNIREVGVEFPLWKRIGVGISVTPLSSVGYRVTMNETDPDILANIGAVSQTYLGTGGVTQAKAGIGAAVFKRLSIGAELIYYHGKIDRSFNMIIDPVLSGIHYNQSQGNSLWEISRVSANFGFQYDILANSKRLLTVGATYQPKTNMKPRITRSVYSTNIFADSIEYSSGKSSFYMPHAFTVGLFYQTPKLGVGLDYSSQFWSGINPGDELNHVVFKNNNFIKAGVQYTPKPGDDQFFNKLTYRFGVRYNDYYMVINDRKINDIALTAGIGIPIRVQGLSSINIGVELGQRGNTATGQFGTQAFRMVRERYFKISVGLSLFGEDYWFQKYKYH